MGAGWRPWRLIWSLGHFGGRSSLRWHGTDSRSFCSDSYVRMQHLVRRSIYVPCRPFLGDVRRYFVQRLSTALHGTLGSYFRDALQEGIVDVMACLLVPRA
jgi:hypothetical protein